MPKVRLDSAKFSTIFGKQIKQRVLLDFQSTPGKRQVLTRQFDESLNQEADRLINKVVPEVTLAAKSHYKDSFDIVGHQLKNGLRQFGSIQVDDEQMPYEFKPFTREYARRKAFTRPGTQFLYWKFYGNLSKAYRQFSSVRKGSVTRTRGVSQVKSRGYKYRGRVYRYQLEIAFPKIGGNPYLDSIFREAYLTASYQARPHLPQGLDFEGGTKGNPMEILTLLESTGHKWSRPFITELMSMRGAAVRSIMLGTLTNKWKSIT